jgi:Tfp pilus tip-associated adhesin PilY1
VSGFVLSFKNQYLEQIYGGDLNGDVWRWDVSNKDPSKWSTTKFAELASRRRRKASRRRRRSRSTSRTASTAT